MRDGDEYVINGQKMWTSLAGDADYCWLAVRTDPDAKKHSGISMIIVPMDTPGITLQPLKLLGEHDINATFFDDVRVPAEVPRRRGERRLGAHHQPAQPRAGHALLERRDGGHLAAVRKWAQETKLPDGRRVIDQEWVQMTLARVHARLSFLRLMNWKVAWSAQHGRLDPADASTVKVFGTELNMEAYRLLMEIIGPRVVPQAGLARIGAAQPPRAGHPRLDHPHLRRWNQRAAARPDRDVRPRLPARVPLTRRARNETSMDFSLDRGPGGAAPARRARARRPVHPRTPEGGCLRRRLVAASTSRCGASWPSSASSASGFPKRPAAAGSGFTEVAWFLKKSAATSRRCRRLPVMAMAGPFLAKHAPDQLAGLATRRADRHRRAARHDR